MPIYEYQCKSCGRRSEEFQKMSDPPLTECKECGGELKKLISAPAVQFKGSGWYVTDYAGKGGSKGEGDATGSAKESSGSGSKEGGGEGSGSRNSGSKDSGAKDSGAKDSGAKDSGAKDSGSRDKSSKDKGSKGSRGSSGSSTGTSSSG